MSDQKKCSSCCISKKKLYLHMNKEYQIVGIHTKKRMFSAARIFPLKNCLVFVPRRYCLLYSALSLISLTSSSACFFRPTPQNRLIGLRDDLINFIMSSNWNLQLSKTLYTRGQAQGRIIRSTVNPSLAMVTV